MASNKASLTQLLTFIGGALMFINAILVFFGLFTFFPNSILMRVLGGIIGIVVSLAVILASHVVKLDFIPFEIPYNGIVILVLGIIGVFTCGYIGPWIVIIAGILFLAWKK